MSRSQAGAPSFTEVTQALARAGWRVEFTARQHVKCYAPDGKTLVIGSGRYKGRGSDDQAIWNFLRDLKRGGFQWPPVK